MTRDKCNNFHQLSYRREDRGCYANSLFEGWLRDVDRASQANAGPSFGLIRPSLVIAARQPVPGPDGLTKDHALDFAFASTIASAITLDLQSLALLSTGIGDAAMARHRRTLHRKSLPTGSAA